MATWSVVVILALALSALLVSARPQDSAPVAVAALLAPDWSNPGAWLTDLSLITADGSITHRTTTPKFYGAIAASAAAQEIYASTCGYFSTCSIDTFDLKSLARKSTASLSDAMILELHYESASQQLVATVRKTSTQAITVAIVDPVTGNFTQLLPQTLGAGQYVARSALDAAGNQLFVVGYPSNSGGKCIVYTYNFASAQTTQTAYDCSRPNSCNTLYANNVQYLPSTKLLYFVPSGSDLVCSLNPATGSVVTLLNISAAAGTRAQGQYYGSLANVAASQYWVQVMSPFLPLQVFWAQITASGSSAKFQRGADGAQIYVSSLIA